MGESRHFTVEQANATLPLVRRIVSDIVLQYRLWQEKMNEVDLVAASGRASDAEAMARLEKDTLALARDLDSFRRELDELGIQLKEPGIGLIDFPSTMDGRPILLCWRLGEPEIGFWHDLTSGYAGRQPLAPAPIG